MVVKIIRKGNSIGTQEITPTFARVKGKIVIKKKASPREKRAVAEFAKVGKKAPALRRAGYPESMARNPGKVFDKPEVQAEVETVLSKLEAERDAILADMVGKRHKANYGTLAMTLGIINKDIELLSGRPTDRQAYELPEEEKARLRKLLQRNKAK